jgi:hypothetical protein
MGRDLIELPQTKPRVSWEAKVTVKFSPGKTRGTEYPCDCRFCRKIAAASRQPESGSLATIDVYDLPDGTVPDYFH